MTAVASRRATLLREVEYEPGISLTAGILRLAQLIGSPDDPRTVAAEALDACAAVAQFHSASMFCWDPVDERHHAIASCGYVERGTERCDPSFREQSRSARFLHSTDHRDLDLQGAPNEAVVMRLEAGDGRYTGYLQFGMRSRRTAGAVNRALGAMRPLLAAIIDRLRTPSAIARVLAPDAAAAIVTGQGRVIELPGRSSGDHLAPGSPLVHVVADLVDDSAATSRFLWKDETGKLHRVRIERLPEGAVVSEQECCAPSRLTPRELDVLTLLVEGRSNREIASLLVISLRTAATHVEHILEKLACASRAAAAARAMQAGLVRYPLVLPGA